MDERGRYSRWLLLLSCASSGEAVPGAIGWGLLSSKDARQWTIDASDETCGTDLQATSAGILSSTDGFSWTKVL